MHPMLSFSSAYRRKYSYIALAAVLSAACFGAPPIRSVNDALALDRTAAAAFASGDYTRAHEGYDLVAAYLRSNGIRKGFDRVVYDIPILDVVSDRAALTMNDRPIQLRFLVIYVAATDIPGRVPRRNMNPDSIRRANIAQDCFSRYVEVLTRGRVTCTFERHVHDAVVTDILISTNFFEGTSSLIHKLALDSIRPYPGMLASLPRFDSLLAYWEQGALNGRPTGGMWPVALGNGRTVTRGYLQFPVSYEWPGTLLHEFFHTVEDIYHISPRHGFADSVRTKFPGWKGQGQYDYYRWHFETTVAQAGFGRIILREQSQ